MFPQEGECARMNERASGSTCMCLVLTPRPCPGARLFCGRKSKCRWLEIGPWAGPCPRWWVISLRQDGRPRASGDLGGATRVRLLHTPLPALCCAPGSAWTGDAGRPCCSLPFWAPYLQTGRELGRTRAGDREGAASSVWRSPEHL